MWTYFGVESPTRTMTEKDRIRPWNVKEGMYVVMRINAHNYRKTGTELSGKVTFAYASNPQAADSIRSEWKEARQNGETYRPMCDVKVTDSDGISWTWNVDNGYVLGPGLFEDNPERVTDIGRFAGFFEP